MTKRSRSELVDALQEMVDLLVLAEGGRSSFRARAFAQAAKAVADDADTVTMSPARLKALPGIGKSTAEVIQEYFRTGRIARLEELRSLYPAELVELTRIPGLGAKTVLRLRDEAGISNLAGLRKAIREERVSKLPGMGGWTEEKLTTAIDHIGSKHDRRPIHVVLPIAEAIVNELSQLPEVSEAHLGGSLRRLKSTIADVDVLVVSEDPASVLSYFLDMPRVTDLIVKGERMASVYVESGLQVDLRVCPPGELGPAMLHFSSGRNHNIRLRMRAHDLGLSLNEHSLHYRGTDDVVSQGSEEEIYRLLELPWIAPGLRQGRGEIVAAAEGRLPNLVELDALRGDLRTHYRAETAEALVRAARERGYEYLAIASSAQTPSAKQSAQAQLAAWREGGDELLLLHAAFVEIDAEGYFDYSEEDRGAFDFCIASVAGHLSLPESEQSERLITAMEDPAVRILSQATGRRIGEFRGIEFDEHAVLEAARENDVAIEIGSDLTRLDPPSSLIRRGMEAGNLFVVNSCASDAEGLAQIEYGVRHSHRGWLDRSKCVNTWKRARFEEWLRAPYS
jgi:DNA polymerase (family 10)